MCIRDRNKADADRLNLNGSATLDFPQHYTGTVSATVMSKSEPDGSGKVAVVFACNAALSDTLAMRKTTADVVYSEHTGLRVPLKAVHMDDDGQAFVYVVTAAQLDVYKRQDMDRACRLSTQFLSGRGIE